MTALIEHLQAKHESMSSDIASLGQKIQDYEFDGDNMDDAEKMLDKLSNMIIEALTLGDRIRALLFIRNHESN